MTRSGRQKEQVILVIFPVVSPTDNLRIGQKLQVFPHSLLQKPRDRIIPTKDRYPLAQQHVPGMLLPDMYLFMHQNLFQLFRSIVRRTDKHPMKKRKRTFSGRKYPQAMPLPFQTLGTTNQATYLPALPQKTEKQDSTYQPGKKHPTDPPIHFSGSRDVRYRYGRNRPR